MLSCCNACRGALRKTKQSSSTYRLFKMKLNLSLSLQTSTPQMDGQMGKIQKWNPSGDAVHKRAFQRAFDTILHFSSQFVPNFIENAARIHILRINSMVKFWQIFIKIKGQSLRGNLKNMHAICAFGSLNYGEKQKKMKQRGKSIHGTQNQDSNPYRHLLSPLKAHLMKMYEIFVCLFFPVSNFFVCTRMDLNFPDDHIVSYRITPTLNEIGTFAWRRGVFAISLKNSWSFGFDSG